MRDYPCAISLSCITQFWNPKMCQSRDCVRSVRHLEIARTWTHAHIQYASKRTQHYLKTCVLLFDKKRAALLWFPLDLCGKCIAALFAALWQKSRRVFTGKA